MPTLEATASPAPTAQPASPTVAILPTETPLPSATDTAVPTQAQSAGAFPDAGRFAWSVATSGLQDPVSLANAADGSGRLFVVEQPGRIMIIREGDLLAQPFLDIRSGVGSRGSEQGLLGLAFHPRYAENGFFFVNYTDLNGDTVIARFQVSQADPDQADPASEKRLLRVAQPYPNHNGGQVAFGPDGALYLGLGDGGSGGDPQGNGQSLTTLLGKILRLDVDGGDPYAIPADNPFASGGGKPEIWAYGLRNPWRFSFDRLTGDLYIADVGQNQWEEINFVAAGAPGGLNFGWNFFEATHPYQGAAPVGLKLTAPVAEYSHAEGCSVTGGVVYRGSRLPDWQGVYLFADYCTGRVWGLLRDGQGRWQNRALFDGVGRVSSFGEDETGEVYLLDHAGDVLILGEK